MANASSSMSRTCSSRPSSRAILSSSTVAGDRWLRRRQPQEQSGTPCHPGGRRQAPVSAEVLPRLQSNRAALRQAQTLPAKRRQANPRGPLRRRRRDPAGRDLRRMPQLSRQFRLWTNLNSSRSNPSGRVGLQTRSIAAPGLIRCPIRSIRQRIMPARAPSSPECAEGGIDHDGQPRSFPMVGEGPLQTAGNRLPAHF